MEFLATRFPRECGEFGLRQAVEKQSSIAFCEQARIEQRDEAAIGLGANQPADTLPKLDEGVGQGEFVEGTAARVADVFALGFGDGMSGGIEGEARDDHLRERVAGDIDAGPKTIGAKEHGVTEIAHLVGQFGAGELRALNEKWPSGGAENRLEGRRDRAHVGVAGEKHERPAAHLGHAEADVIGEYIEREFGFLRGGQGNVGSDEDAHVALEIEGRLHDDGAGGVGADAGGKRLDLPTHREGGAGASDARAAAEKMFSQGGRDVDGRTAQGDDGLFAAAAFGPVDVIFIAEREPRGDAGLEALDALFVIEELVAFAAVLEGVADFAEDAVDRSEWSVEGGLGDAFRADAHDGALSEQRGGEGHRDNYNAQKS